MRDQWFRQGDAFILLYNITLRTTFEEIQKFYDLVLKAKDADRPGPMILGIFFPPPLPPSIAISTFMRSDTRLRN